MITLQIYPNLYIQTLNNNPLQPLQPLITENIQNELNVLTTKKEFIIDKTYFKNDFYSNHNSKNKLGFLKPFYINDMRYKSVFMISLHYIKFKFYFLIGLSYIMHLHIILHIHLH